MEKRLRALGLSSYEAKVFLTYDVLRELENRGAVYVQNSRPKIYAVPDVERAIDNILRSRMEEVQKELSEMESLAEELKKELKVRKKGEELEAFWSFAMGIEKSLNLILQRLESVQKSLLNIATPQELSFFVSEKRKFARVVASLLEKEIELRILTTREVAEIFPPADLRVPEVRIVDDKGGESSEKRGDAWSHLHE
ncbi:MAG: HTH-type transcriptional regulator, sugar sensing transcriptional regulator [Archaeoglobi archaeon]|nr:HTH-type transcriptional regulator, sugar sensing transcriptional regulator [Archaeoglobi archaeon]